MASVEGSSKRIWILVLIGVVLGCGVLYYMALPKGTDTEQIKSVLKEAVVAGRSGKAGSVLDLLSKAFEINGARPEMKDISDAIRRFRPDCDVADVTPSISGDDAAMDTSVHVHGSFLGSSVDTSISHVRLSFHREGAMVWGIVPVQAWKLREIGVDDATYDGSPLSGWIRGLSSP